MFLYLITNTENGHQYVGVTSRSVLCRWKEHQSDAARGCNFVLHKAIRKYGSEKFVVSEISSFSSLESLLEAEVYAIKHLNTKTPNGYNVTNGGEGTFGKKQSASTRRKISKAHKGKKLSREHRKKLSISKTGKKLPPFTKSHKMKISKARMGHGFDRSTLIKMSLAKKGKPWTKARRIAYESKLLQ